MRLSHKPGSPTLIRGKFLTLITLYKQKTCSPIPLLDKETLLSSNGKQLLTLLNINTYKVI